MQTSNWTASWTYGGIKTESMKRWELGLWPPLINTDLLVTWTICHFWNSICIEWSRTRTSSFGLDPSPCLPSSLEDCVSTSPDFSHAEYKLKSQDLVLKCPHFIDHLIFFCWVSQVVLTASGGVLNNDHLELICRRQILQKIDHCCRAAFGHPVVHKHPRWGQCSVPPSCRYFFRLDVGS